MSWSDKYKRSINCDSPKGFSQRAHCAARKKRAEGESTKSKSPFNEMHEVKSHKSVEQIAKKHRLEVSFVKKQLEMGIPIEHEHTKDKDLATDIALQHLGEIPDYYTRLKKMEASAKKEHKKFKDVKEGTLHHWFKGSKSKSGKPGWVQADGSPCANEPGETKTPKCFSSGRLSALKRKGKKGKSIIAAAVRRKREQDPGQQQKTGAAKPTNVPTFAKGKKNKNYVKAEPGIKEAMELNEAQKDRPSKGSGSKDACYHKVKSRYKVWPSAYASGALVKCRKVGADNWGNKNEEYKFSNWRDEFFPTEIETTNIIEPEKLQPSKGIGSKLLGEKTEMIRYCPKCKKDETRSECKYGGNFWDMYSVPSSLGGNNYTPNTPHPGNFPEAYDHEYSMARSELSTIISAAKRLRKKIGKGEGNLEAWVQSKITKAADYIDTAADYIDSGEMKEEVKNTDKKPFDIAVKKIMDRKLPPKKRILALKQAGKYQGVDEEKSFTIPNAKPVYKFPYLPKEDPENVPIKITPSTKEPRLPLAKKKTSETQVAHYEPKGEMIDEKCWPGYKKKGMRTMFGKRYPNCVKAEEYSNWRADFGLSEDWQKINRQDKTDGLSQKAVNAYRRENPGSKLQTAVTEKKPTGKRAKRRASFCRRMKGMKSKLTSAKTARDPDSRINKALRRWNCH